MTVSISKMSIDYYLMTAAGGDGAVVGNNRDLTSYYTESEDPAGTWFGKGLDGLSMVEGQQVEKWAAKKLYEDMQDPETGQQLGRAPIKSQKTPDGALTPKGEAAKESRNPVHGFDLTFSAPKSVSTLWAMADPELQGQIHAAHKQAVAETLAWAEANVIQTRAGHAGVAHVPVTGLVGSLFDHADSRLGDPQLHTHAVIHNRVQRTSDNQWTTIDSYTLHRHVVAISERYNSLLFDRLAQSAGTLAEVRDDNAPNLTADSLSQVVKDHQQAATEELIKEQEPYNARVELAGIPDELISEFSTRSAMIEERKNELLAQWRETTGLEEPPRHILLRMRQQATLETRTPKDKTSPVALSEKMDSWRGRAEAMHYSPAQIIHNATGHENKTITRADLTNETIDQLGAWTLQDTGLRRTTFTRANLLASAERILRTVRCETAEHRDELAAAIVDSATEQAVTLTPERGIAPRLGIDEAVMNRGRSIFDHHKHAGLFTTQHIMNDERFLMDRVRAEAASITPETLGTSVADMRTREGHSLSSDQESAVTQVLTSGKALDAIIGPAGTGKTTTMKAIRDLWTEHHGQSSVIGLAPSAVAAGVLSDEINASTDNTAKWLYESVGDGASRRISKIQHNEQRLSALEAKLPDATGTARTRLIAQRDGIVTTLAQTYAEQAKYAMRKDQLIIIDEASMVGTQTLAELARQADTAGAKLLLVGDPKQLDAIDAGGFLGWMEKEADSAKLDQVWRFRDEGQAPTPEHWEAQASLQLREGDEDVLTTYDEHGRIIHDPETSAIDNAYQGWITDTLNNRDSLMVGATNEQVHTLNTRAQLDLVESGHVSLDQVVTLRNDVSAGIGDVLLARKNNRNLRDSNGAFIANGVRIRITDINEDGTAIGHRTDNDATIRLDPAYLAQSVELGYASTAHRAQGVTVDTCHTIAQQGIPRELFYVAMTRGKNGNYAYIDMPEQTETPDQWDMMKQVMPDTKIGILKGILNTTTASTTAHETMNAEHGWAKDYGRMAHEAIYLSIVAKATRTNEWITEHYGPQTLSELQASPDWNKLVTADPAQTIAAPPEMEESSIGQLLLHVDSTQEPTEHVVAGLVPDYAPASEDQEEIKTDLFTRMDERLNQMTALALEVNPEWVQQVTTDYAGNEWEAVRLHLAWRSITDQDDAVIPLGFVPEETDRYKNRFYQRTLAELKTLKPTEPQHEPTPAPDAPPTTEPQHTTESTPAHGITHTTDAHGESVGHLVPFLNVPPAHEDPGQGYWDELFTDEPPVEGYDDEFLPPDDFWDAPATEQRIQPPAENIDHHRHHPERDTTHTGPGITD